jgi:hypothetical protein
MFAKSTDSQLRGAFPSLILFTIIILIIVAVESMDVLCVVEVVVLGP